MEKKNEIIERLKRVPESRRGGFLKRLSETVAEHSPGDLLSFRQEQLCVLNRIGRNAGYELAFHLHLTGELNHGALRGAVGDILEQHPVLRSVFPAGEVPDRRVLSHRAPDLRPEDISDLDAGRRREHLGQALADELRYGLDFETGPLLRTRLFTLAPDRHLLMVVTHYLVADPESLGILRDRLADCYAARARGSAPAPAAPAGGFNEFVSWQRRFVDGAAGAASADWWRDGLIGWEPTELPTGHTRPGTLDLASDQVTRDLDPALLAAVETFAAGLAVSPEAVLLAAYGILLARYTRQDDLVIGTPVRVGPGGADTVVGDCGNLLPLRLDCAGSHGLAELAARCHTALDEARKHAAVPFKRILDAAGFDQDASRLPLVQLGFAVDPAPRPSRRAAGLEIGLEQIPTGGGTFEALLRVRLDPAAPALTLEYATSLYHERGSAQLLDHYERLLRAGLAAPGSRHTALPMTSPAERRQVTTAWNPPGTPRGEALLHETFLERARLCPDAPALVWRTGTMTYGELAERVERLAGQLRGAGVGPEHRVAVLVDRGPWMVEALLGVLAAGGAYVPLDPAYPDDRIGMVLDDSAATAVITRSALRDRVPPGPWQVVDLDGPARPAAGPTPGAVPVTPGNLAYVIYTSGTTARPKGVLIEHRNATNFIRTVQEMFALGPEDRVLQFASLGFDVSVFEIFGALLSGARLYLATEDEKRSTEALDRVLIDQEITVIDLPPAVMGLLQPERYRALRVAFVGGEAFSGELTTAWAAGGRAFHNGYGPTECTVTVVAKHCTGVWDTSPPIGRAMANHRAYVLDGESAALPVGVPGELAIAGDGLARGYLGRADLTAERFRPDPYGPPGSRMYLSGDLADWTPDGDLVFRGRVDRQVKVRGIRIELRAVESVLDAHPQVSRAVVVTAHTPAGETVLVAHVAPLPGATVDPEGLREWVAGKLPRPMVPSLVSLVDAIPLTPSGKLDVRNLPPVAFQATEDEVDQRDWTPTQRRVAGEVFVPLLAAARVGLRDSFFSIGGTSLEALRVIPRLRAAFGVEVPVADFFQDPTVAGVAATVDRAVVAQRSRQEGLLRALAEVEGRSEEEIAEMTRERFGDAER
ncbi:non-ribosomal peptide synthetase [Streptomyces sp. NPDC001889]